MGQRYAEPSDVPTYARRGTLDDSEVGAYLDRASAIADDYLGKRLDLPLAPNSWSQSLTMHVVDLAVWLMMRDIGFKPGTTDAETVRQGWEDAMKWLSDVAIGKADPSRVDFVGAEEEAVPQEQRFVQSQVSGQEAGISREDDFFGVGERNPQGVVGIPRLRGW